MFKSSLFMILGLILTFTVIKYPVSAEEVAADEAQYDWKILFVGNSYIFTNDLPAVFKKLAASGGINIYCDSSTKGGYKLEQHLDEQDEVGSKTLEKIKDVTKKWDFVVLQEQSLGPVYNTLSFKNSVNLLNEIILENNENAKTALYMTWGRRDGFEDYTFEEMNQKLELEYTNAASEINGVLIPAGKAWADLRAKNEELGLSLWKKDKSHPTYKGTYLNACVYYASLFNKTPVGLWYDSEKITEEEANLIQTVAAEVCGLDNQE